MKKNIIIIGGAGYIGNVVADYFLKKNYEVISYDNLIYKNKPISKFLKHKNFKFIKGDLRNLKKLSVALKNQKNVVILAGLVGDPITKKYPKLSEKINYQGIKKLILLCNKTQSIERLVFVSTCSNYGIGKGKKLLNERAPLRPISHYSKQKVKIEKFILNLKNKNFSPVILRFATAFGLSLRMRFDLTINHFTKSFIKKEILKIFDPETSRPYCHVIDFARSIEKVLISEKKKIDNQVFNIGNNKNNYSKQNIINRISKLIPKTKLIYLKGDVDKRDYKVDFNKAKKVLKFVPKYSIKDGILEIKKFLIQNKNLNFKKLGNYNINKF